MRVIKVQGRGRINATPDIVRLSLGVAAQSRDYEESVRLLNKQVEKLIESIVAAGLERHHLKTKRFYVEAKYVYKDGERRLSRYEASHRLMIEMALENSLLNRVLAHIASGGSMSEVTLEFAVENSEALHKAALEAAVKVAKENAKTLAEAAGVRLGKLIQMDYGWAEVRIYEERESTVLYAPSEPNFDIDPDDVEAEDNVTLVYEIVGEHA